jgi:hypothetical protein
MRLFAMLLFALALGGCAGTITKDPGTGAVSVDLTTGKVEVAAHKDMLGAAAAATKAADAATDPMLKAALQVRAARWLAADNVVTMVEKQGSVCGNAILAMKPQLQAMPEGAGPLTKAELLAEDVGTFSGVTPAAKLACADFPPLILPVLPKLP